MKDTDHIAPSIEAARIPKPFVGALAHLSRQAQAIAGEGSVVNISVEVDAPLHRDLFGEGEQPARFVFASGMVAVNSSKRKDPSKLDVSTVDFVHPDKLVAGRQAPMEAVVIVDPHSTRSYRIEPALNRIGVAWPGRVYKWSELPLPA